jgi:hypothetical protein
MCHFYNKIRKNLLIICPIFNLQGCKGENVSPKEHWQVHWLGIQRF